MRFCIHRKAVLIGLAALALGACGPTVEHQPSFGEAWVAPATLQVRKELTLHSPVSVMLHRGDKVELLARRRRFIKIRASNGASGWTDSRLLFSADAREKFDDLQERTSAAPTLGQATVLDAVSVHTAPFRQAPGLFQLAPKQTVQIIAHQRVERVPWDPPPLLEELALRPRSAKSKKEPPSIPPPPPGPPPAVPDDWLLISGYMQDQLPDEKANQPPPAAVPVLDDWTLIRVPGGPSGWVLDRVLYLSIPDEVVQYAERARIVAYYGLGSVKDGALEKTVWLWASQSSAARHLEFDSLRIFNWSVRRHRYETSWIERGVQGVGPVVLTREGTAINGFYTFAVEKDGHVMRRNYVLQNYRARIAARVAEQPPAPWFIAPPRANQPQTYAAPTEKVSLWQKSLRWFNRLRGGNSR